MSLVQMCKGDRNLMKPSAQKRRYSLCRWNDSRATDFGNCKESWCLMTHQDWSPNPIDQSRLTPGSQVVITHKDAEITDFCTSAQKQGKKRWLVEFWGIWLIMFFHVLSQLSNSSGFDDRGRKLFVSDHLGKIHVGDLNSCWPPWLWG